VTTDPRDFGSDIGLMRIESLHKTHSLGSGGAARPKKFGSSLMPQSSNLGEAPLSYLKFLGSERGFFNNNNNNN